MTEARDVRDGEPIEVWGCPKGFSTFKHPEGIYFWSEKLNLQAFACEGGRRSVMAVREILRARGAI